MVTGFHLILRKSNLVPLSRVHDEVHNIVRRDVHYKSGVMIIMVRWSKTNQFRERISKNPMIRNNNSLICPVRWILHMVHTVPAQPSQNLFSFYHPRLKRTVPITYRELMTKMRKWLELIGVTNSKKFSSHLLHRGGSTHAFDSKIPEHTIMDMGGWASDCYKRYIDMGISARIQAWKKFTQG